MTISSSVSRRILLAGGFSIAIAAAPAVAFFAAPSNAPSGPAIACPAGESEDLYTDQCIPELVPNQPGGNYPTPSSGGGNITFSTPGDPNSVPEVQGIPCTGSNTGQCIGLEENQMPAVTPHSSISSSP
ncbi:intersectin-EH binding protein Ibp1 [Mycobacterium sp. CVI_P3]|uniref:Intersectin-EH binding protein Ibp1 n=1 Tax=Mycobacterium pinniadriaticum TaxID=2994102 RepID=A0ABT3S7U6_9MYCO|nr:intersectin-EH binding protein Ibp1 [Mycobacterium pinniadriaticum]MCX2928904.1 intersectin-EH binding protein Ibp1 [Mycobacterium pinniadriaticum]MCX2935229.1 intersectin-EH binding protein Ibp1 [Mycobacterium pinniadriaticum]